MKLKADKIYLFSVMGFMLIFPVLSFLAEIFFTKHFAAWELLGKWFVFWTIGVRLFTAGLKQAINPLFTTQYIFQIKSNESFAIVRELGFSNICIGLTGIVSLFMPHWRVVAAFTGGLYLGIAGLQHIVKGSLGFNESLAMISDIFVFFMMAWFCFMSY